MREFVSAGGELIIHGAAHLKNTPTPELIRSVFTHNDLRKKGKAYMNRYLGCKVVSIAFLISIFGIAVSTAEGASQELTTEANSPNTIITLVANVYKSCKSYADTGIVKTVFFLKNGKFVTDKPFATAFVRPERFRVEYSSKFPMPGAKPMRHIIWANGKEVRTWWDLKPGIRKHDSLGMAVAGATGVSGGSAHTIPVLLIPEEIGGWSIVELKQLHRLSDVVLNEVACYRLRGKQKAADSESITLWISKKTYLIHRIDSTNKFPKFQTQTTTTYEPQIDIVIDENRLAIDAPEEVGLSLKNTRPGKVSEVVLKPLLFAVNTAINYQRMSGNI
jgi:outer membrane lipoprotein-sorting protein